MARKQDIDLIEKVFSKAFDRDRFEEFAIRLLNEVDREKAFSIGGGQVPEAFRKHITHYQRIGQYTDPEGEVLDIMVVPLSEESAIDRARTMQRNFITWYLNKRGHKDAALVAFYHPKGKVWRLSFIRLDYVSEMDAKGKVKSKVIKSPPRRFSYLVGEGEPNHTARTQILPIFSEQDQNPSLAELENAFSIDRVTNAFFDDYQSLFHRVRDAIIEKQKQIPAAAAEFKKKNIDPDDFAKKLLGQIVFLYFLQKKGWLGVAKNADWGTGPKNFLRQLFKDRTQENFYDGVLEPLFYEALATDRHSNQYWFDQLSCRIPFLNGGLFEPLRGFDWVNVSLPLEDELFSDRDEVTPYDEGRGILDVFDRYNFTVREDEPLEKEVAVDPEMLGRVFENLLIKEERRFKGTFYTPSEVVHYMSQSCLYDYLKTELCLRRGLDIPEEELQRFVFEGQQIEERELVAGRKIEEGQKNSVYQQQLPAISTFAAEVDRALEEIRVCDPAIGSGAFPVGMMYELVRTREFLARIRGEECSSYELKRDAIQDAIYGVDIDASAVEIAKLRMWLSLVVDEEDFKKIRPLPNLDYKIMQGNSLFSDFMGLDLDEMVESIGHSEDAFSIIHSSGDEEEKASMIANLKAQKRKFLNAGSQSEKEVLREEIERQVLALFRFVLRKEKEEYFKALDKLQAEAEMIPNAEQRENYRAKKKQKLNRKHDLNLDLLENRLALYTRNRDNRDFFPWRLYFGEVFEEKGGFDVLIGNPPYVRQEQIKEIKPRLKAQYEVYNGTADLYTYFIERAWHLMRQDACFAFITSQKYVRAKYGNELRTFLSEKTELLQYIDFKAKQIFPSAIVDTAILMFRRRRLVPDHKGKHNRWIIEGTKAEYELRYCQLTDEYDRGAPLGNFIWENEYSFPQTALGKEGWIFLSSNGRKLMKTISDRGKPLSQWEVEINYGIKSGLNDAFYVREEKYKELVEKDAANYELLKPILRGRHIGRYQYHFENTWLIFIPWHFPLHEDKISGASTKAENAFSQQYPSLYNHLSSFRPQLEKRNQAETGIRYEWYALQRCASTYLNDFEKEKIVWIELTDRPQFTLDRKGHFLNDTTFMMVGDSLRYLLAVLNSKVCEWYFDKITTSSGMGTNRWKKVYVDRIPVPSIPTEDRTPFERIVDYLLFLKSDKVEFLKSKDHLMPRWFEQLIDGLVFELFFPDAFEKAGRHIARHLGDLPKLPSDIPPAEKLKKIRETFDQLYDRKHPVRNALFFLDSIEEVKIILADTES